MLWCRYRYMVAISLATVDTPLLLAHGAAWSTVLCSALSNACTCPLMGSVATTPSVSYSLETTASCYAAVLCLLCLGDTLCTHHGVLHAVLWCELRIYILASIRTAGVSTHTVYPCCYHMVSREYSTWCDGDTQPACLHAVLRRHGSCSAAHDTS
jgi:hypothetical protein